ncbi:MAG: DNA polymerase/3'-5' exonuclease PolX [Polyangiales bacterium]
MVNGHVALAFDELATLLELEGESPFKVRAYRAFADDVRALVRPLAELDAAGGLESMPGVGKAIASKARELLRTGVMDRLERARAAVPPSLRDLLRVPGLGPAKVRKLWQEAHVTTVPELVAACRQGRVAALAGFGAKGEAKLLADAEALLSTLGHVLLAQAHALVADLAAELAAAGLSKVRTVGAVRRGHEVVDALELVVADGSPQQVAAALASSTTVRVIETAATEVHALPIGLDAPKIRLRCTNARGFVETMLVETGDAAHVASLAALALARGTTLGALCGGLDDEEAAYAALGVPFVPPELRDGPFAAPPPRLLPLGGVRGVFHVHTTWSDGTASVVDMARAAAEAGYAYVGISDHSRAASYAHGLDVDRLLAQRDDVARARAEVPQIAILHGIEVDVMEDGSLDLPDDVLVQLDFVVASVHAQFHLDRATQTRRMVRALSHPLVTILGHPTGRLLLGRPGDIFDLDAVARAAAEGGACLEVNARPQRLDLCPEMIRRASALGATFCINPDAHEPRGFADVPLGVAQARRAALRSEQVFNALDLSAVTAALTARRRAGAARLGVHAPS